LTEIFVDRGEVPDFGDVVGRHIDRRRDVAFNDANAIAERLCAFAREVCELRLDEADGIRLRRSSQEARQQFRSEETGVAGEEERRHENISPQRH
jgi:hypothetical protein